LLLNVLQAELAPGVSWCFLVFLALASAARAHVFHFCVTNFTSLSIISLLCDIYSLLCHKHLCVIFSLLPRIFLLLCLILK
jgi:uncharacterized membrane protein